MDFLKLKTTATARATSIVTRSQAAASETNAVKQGYSKRKTASPMQRANKKPVFKDLTNREAVKDPVKSKAQLIQVDAAAKKLAKTKISDESKKTVRTQTNGSKGNAKTNGGINTYFRVTKQAGKIQKFELKTKPTVQVKNEVPEKCEPSKPEESTEKNKSAVLKSETLDKSNSKTDNINVGELSISSRDSSSPLYVTALENLSSTVNESTLEPADLDPTVPPKRDLPSGVQDFDAENWTDPFQVSNYATDIFNYFKSRETEYRVNNYMHNQSDLTTGMRTVAVDWMVELQENFELNHETLYLAVKLLDTYLSKVPVKRGLLQLVASASLLIASKYDERFPPSIEDYLYVCEGMYSKKELMAMEISILKKLDFNLGFPISYRFLRRYARFGKIDMPTLTLARYILEYSLMDYSFISESDSKLAASALLLALKMKSINEWSPNLKYSSGYEEKDLKEITSKLNSMLNRAAMSTAKLTAVRNKYSHKIFFEVAKLPLLEQVEFTSMHL